MDGIGLGISGWPLRGKYTAPYDAKKLFIRSTRTSVDVGTLAQAQMSSMSCVEFLFIAFVCLSVVFVCLLHSLHFCFSIL